MVHCFLDNHSKSRAKDFWWSVVWRQGGGVHALCCIQVQSSTFCVPLVTMHICKWCPPIKTEMVRLLIWAFFSPTMTWLGCVKTFTACRIRSIMTHQLKQPQIGIQQCLILKKVQVFRECLWQNRWRSFMITFIGIENTSWYMAVAAAITIPCI